MGLLTILLFVFGCLATGATRANIYSGDKCIMGGRISAAFVSCEMLACVLTVRGIPERTNCMHLCQAIHIFFNVSLCFCDIPNNEGSWIYLNFVAVFLPL